MNAIANTVVFNAGRAFAFNIVLPVWYAVIHIFGS